MFKQGSENEVETIIGLSVQVEGNFVANGDIVIEGTVSGSIKTEKNLRVGKDAKIFAEISAANAVIAGEVQGNITIRESLELDGSAKVFGDIKTKTIVIAQGAVVQGKCSAGEEKKSKFEKIDEFSRQDKGKHKDRIGESDQLV
ncbi:MAG: polymer-forming cytoskeletal protein [Candidatus Buchananbacteria bacterium]